MAMRVLCECRKISVAFTSIDINKHCFGDAVTHSEFPTDLQEEGIAVILSCLTLLTLLVKI